MKAVRIHEFGGPEVLRYEDAPDPVLRKDQVLVRVKACAMNHLDIWVRKGASRGSSFLIFSVATSQEKLSKLASTSQISTLASVCCSRPMHFCNYCVEMCSWATKPVPWLYRFG